MRRVAIIGPGGAGKTTLARRMGEALGLPVIHLDTHYWHPGWVRTETPEWREKHRALLGGDEWIIDGNYNSTQDERMERADTIIFLDFPRRIYVRRALRRWITNRGRTRPDLPEGCPESFDWPFLKWLWNFRRDTRPVILARLERFRPGRNLIVLRTPRDVSRFMMETCRS